MLLIYLLATFFWPLRPSQGHGERAGVYPSCIWGKQGTSLNESPYVSIGVFSTLLKGSGVVLWCPGTSPCYQNTSQVFILRAWTENHPLLSPVPFRLNYYLTLIHLFGTKVLKRVLSHCHKVSLKDRSGMLVKFDVVNNWLKGCRGSPQVATKFNVGGTSSSLSVKLFSRGVLKLVECSTFQCLL